MADTAEDSSVGILSSRRQALAALAGFATAVSLPVQAVARASSNKFKRITVDAKRIVGTVRNLQGVNRGPAADSKFPDLTRQYRDLRVNLIRTHDYYGAFDIDSVYTRPTDPQLLNDRVDISSLRSIFPDPNADPASPSSYNFGPTDEAIKAIYATGAQPYYRVGRSWGADPTPPDPRVFAEVVRHVAMHYTKGWASGFSYPITYWEIWNEPDFEFIFWHGTEEQFHQLYFNTARALKSVDPRFKVGGPSKAWGASRGAYRENFIAFCRESGAPLDFYSWHSYTNASADPYDHVRIGKQIRQLLDANGFHRTESHNTEWGYGAGVGDPASPMSKAAYLSNSILYMQDAPIEVSTLYHGQRLFDESGHYLKDAYAVKATGMLLDTPERVALSGSDQQGFAAVAGLSTDRKKFQLLISNYETPSVSPLAGPQQLPPDAPSELREFVSRLLADIHSDAFLPFRNNRYDDNNGYNLQVRNLPFAGEHVLQRFRLDEGSNLELVETTTGSGSNLRLSRDMMAPSVELIVVEAA